MDRFRLAFRTLVSHWRSQRERRNGRNSRDGWLASQIERLEDRRLLTGTIDGVLGQDSNAIDEMEIVASSAFLNFNDYTLSSYGGSPQDVTGAVTIEDGGLTLRMTGNRWKALDLAYNVTANTVLEFDFQSSTQGEIHAIGFDADDGLSQNRVIQLYGTQPWGFQGFDNYSGSGVQHYVIPVGDFFTGPMNFLTFGMDDDASAAGESVFSNILIREEPAILNFNDYTLSSYGGSPQDVTGVVTIEDGGSTLRMTGNRWKVIDLEYNVTANTVLEFDFQSSTQGEIHAIGLDADDGLSQNRVFQLYGTQPWGIQGFHNYAGSGVQHYEIPVGDFFTGPMNFLTFGMDDDASAAGESVFSNILIRESVEDLVDSLLVSIDIDSIREIGGSATATVTRSGDTSQALVVAISHSDSDSSEIALPGTVTIQANESSATFDILALHDAIPDGRQTITIQASATGLNSDAEDIDVWDNDAFAIDVIFTDNNLSASQQAVFQTAADRWAEMILGDLPDVYLLDGTLVDDVVIEVSAPAIDGAGGILGQAGPTQVRSASFLPAAGIMQFDIADVNSLEDSGQLDEVILHEMAHVLGLGTIWNILGLLSGGGGSNPQFIGPQATAEYNAIFGNSDPSVLVANTGGSGTRDSHWREAIFNNELMSGYLNAGVNPISRITVAQFADLGYVVDVSAADFYSPPGGLVSGGDSGSVSGSGSSIIAVDSVSVSTGWEGLVSLVGTGEPTNTEISTDSGYGYPHTVGSDIVVLPTESALASGEVPRIPLSEAAISMTNRDFTAFTSFRGTTFEANNGRIGFTATDTSATLTDFSAPLLSDVDSNVEIAVDADAEDLGESEESGQDVTSSALPRPSESEMIPLDRLFASLGFLEPSELQPA